MSENCQKSIAIIVPQTGSGGGRRASPTITASVKNMGCANLVSLAHFPIPGVVEIFD